MTYRGDAMETYNPKALMQALAHEIRTPLGIVVGYFELLDGGHEFPQAEREAIIRRMREAVRRINGTLEAMETGSLSLQLTEPGTDALHVRGTNEEEAERERREHPRDF